MRAVTFARSLQVAVHPAIPSQSGRIAVLLFNLLDKPIYFRNRFIGQFVVSQIGSLQSPIEMGHRDWVMISRPYLS